MANFIGLVYATLKEEGIDTKGMSTDDAVAKFKELQKKNGGKSGEHEGTPAEQRRLNPQKESIEDLKKEEINKNRIEYIDADGRTLKLTPKEIKEENIKIISSFEKNRKETIQLWEDLDKKGNPQIKRHLEQQIEWGNIPKEEYQERFDKGVKEHRELIKDEKNKLNLFLNKLAKMVDIASDKNWKLSKSPYSDSFYIAPANSSIGWGNKPQGSYRLSDHWNFESMGEKHCLLGDEEYLNDIVLAQYRDGKYYDVEK